MFLSIYASVMCLSMGIYFFFVYNLWNGQGGFRRMGWRNTHWLPSFCKISIVVWWMQGKYCIQASKSGKRWQCCLRKKVKAAAATPTTTTTTTTTNTTTKLFPLELFNHAWDWFIKESCSEIIKWKGLEHKWDHLFKRCWIISGITSKHINKAAQVSPMDYKWITKIFQHISGTIFSKLLH